MHRACFFIFVDEIGALHPLTGNSAYEGNQIRNALRKICGIIELKIIVRNEVS